MTGCGCSVDRFHCCCRQPQIERPNSPTLGRILCFAVTNSQLRGPPSQRPFLPVSSQRSNAEHDWRPVRRDAASARPLDTAARRMGPSRHAKSFKRRAAEKLHVRVTRLSGHLRIDDSSSACCRIIKPGWYADREDKERAWNIKIEAANGSRAACFHYGTL